jgi:hypothetical protein
MHPQLREIERDLHAAGERLHRFARATSDSRWSERPAPGSWSAAECVEHLNLTARAILPRLREALDGARAAGGTPPARFRRGVIGWLIWRASQPTTRMRAKTGSAFEPVATPPPAELLAEFDRLLAEQIATLQRADGLPLQRIRVRSPFGPVSYNAFAAFSILAVHQHRHLQQAERAAETLSARP